MGDLSISALWTVIGLPISLLSVLYFALNRRKNVVLQDKVVFITGASSGLGEGRCLFFVLNHRLWEKIMPSLLKLFTIIT